MPRPAGGAVPGGAARGGAATAVPATPPAPATRYDADRASRTGTRAAPMPTAAFNHVTAEKEALYRRIMRVFAEAKAHFVVHLRPDDVRERAGLEPGAGAEVQAALAQLAQWGNLLERPDHGRVTTVEDFYRARFLYQLSREGEAAQAALALFDELLGRRGALQSVALHDIREALEALSRLAEEEPPDPARVHALLRHLSAVFEGLADNAQAFMAGLGRTLDLREMKRDAFLAYKQQILDYLERFLGDLVVLSADIGTLTRELAPRMEQWLPAVAAREARDAAPGAELDETAAAVDAEQAALAHWRGHWQGLRAWFEGGREQPSQASLLQSATRRAIARLLEMVVRMNEQRLGRSDRSADFRTLAAWFLDCESDDDAHRLWRAAFGLAPARHLGIDAETQARREREPVAADVSWWDSPPLHVSPRLRATGSHARRGPPEKVRSRAAERIRLARELRREGDEAREARRRLATGEHTLLSAIGELDEASFRHLLAWLGDALAAAGDDATIRTTSTDGSVDLELTPLDEHTRARIRTPLGTFSGRDYRLRIVDREAAG